MDKDELRHALKELLLDEEDSRKGKTFVFPENIDKSYNLIKGLSIKQFCIYVVPAFLLGMIILAIPPYTMGFMMSKIMVASIIILIGFAFGVMRPIPERNNITLTMYVKNILEYMNRQKLFFIQPTKRDDFDV